MKRPTFLRSKAEREAARKAAAEKKLADIKELAKVPETAPAEQPKPSTLQQYPIPRVIQIELTRMKDATHRVTTRKGKVALIPRFGNKDVFFFYIGTKGYFIDPAKIIKVETDGKVSEKLVYDVFESEPLNQEGTITFSWDVEHLLRDSAIDQYITVATFEGTFQLTPQLIRIMIAVSVFAGFIGIALNGSLHFVPTVIIHWIP